MILNFICKSIQLVLKKMNRGSSLPGEIALKLNKNFLKRFKLPKVTIFVTGTVGKTTTTATIVSVLNKAGYRVGTNDKGSNLSFGVCSCLIDNSTVTGKSKVDALVIEIDERYVKKVLPYITPDYFVINNLSRDQLARNGHFDIVFNDINDYISEKTHLILNADNPLSYKFSLGRKNKITYFGVAKSRFSSLKTSDKIELSYCPKCHKKLEYEYFNYGNFGSYHCSSCDFKRQMPLYETKITGKNIVIDDEKIKMPNDSFYNAYNLSAAYTVAKLIGISKEVIGEALNNVSFKVKRFTNFRIGKTEGIVMLSKNETPISYNQSLEYVSKQKVNKTVAIGFMRMSGRYDEQDISWFYDVNFELLNDDTIDRILVFGKYGYDIAVRLKLAGVDVKKIKVVYDYNKTYEEVSKCKNKVYCLFYFDLEKMFKKQLEENGDEVW